MGSLRRVGELLHYRGPHCGWQVKGYGISTETLAEPVLAGNESIFTSASWHKVPYRGIVAAIWFELDRMTSRERELTLRLVKCRGRATINIKGWGEALGGAD